MDIDGIGFLIWEEIADEEAKDFDDVRGGGNPRPRAFEASFGRFRSLFCDVDPESVVRDAMCEPLASAGGI